MTGEKTVLQSDISLESQYILNETSGQIVFTSFSQAERDFGYSLIMEKINGHDKKIIKKNIPSLSTITWNQDGNKVAYFQPENKTLSLIDTSGHLIDQKTLKYDLFSLSSSEDGFYLTTKGEPDNSSIVSLNNDLKQLSPNIEDKKGAEINITFLDKNNIVFKRVDNYSNQSINNNTISNIINYNSQQKKESVLDQAVEIVGYINE
jgi:hypothetical protein